MKLNLKIKTSFKLTLLFLFLIIGTSYGQITSYVFKGDVNDLNDEQLSSYYEQTKSQGYTIKQIKAVASAKGVSDSDISKLEYRLKRLINNDKMPKTTDIKGAYTGNSLDLVEEKPSGLTGNEIKKNFTKDSFFGYAFFKNTNISFSPNLNLATPANYQLGPDDGAQLYKLLYL